MFSVLCSNLLACDDGIDVPQAAGGSCPIADQAPPAASGHWGLDLWIWLYSSPYNPPDTLTLPPYVYYPSAQIPHICPGNHCADEGATHPDHARPARDVCIGAGAADRTGAADHAEAQGRIRVVARQR